MKIVSIINYKGGVGKTTLTANVGAELARRGKRVLLMDMDAQCSLTFSFVDEVYWRERLSGEKDGKDKTIKRWFDDIIEEKDPTSLHDLVLQDLRVRAQIASGNGSLHVIPSHLGLINIDLELAHMLNGVPPILKRIRQKRAQVHSLLRGHLRAYAETALYDYVLIDCPPNFNIVTKNALVASDEILIPAKPDYLSTLGITYLQRNLDSLVDDFNDHSASDNISPTIMGVVYTMIQIYRGTPISAQLEYMNQDYLQTDNNSDSIFVFPSTIRDNKTFFASAPEDRIPPVLRNTGTGPYVDIIEEIRALTGEILNILELKG